MANFSSVGLALDSHSNTANTDVTDVQMMKPTSPFTQQVHTRARAGRPLAKRLPTRPQPRHSHARVSALSRSGAVARAGQSPGENSG